MQVKRSNNKDMMLFFHLFAQMHSLQANCTKIEINKLIQNFHMEQIIEYLKQPTKSRLSVIDENRYATYLLTYIGELFVQGYRLIQNYGSLLLFSLMQFQFSDSPQAKKQRRLKNMPPRFKLLLWQISSQEIFGDGRNRREKFNQMILIGSLLDQVQYHLVYLRELRYSIVSQQILETNGIPDSRQYFKKISWIEHKKGRSVLTVNDQGKQLHRLLQMFIKGAGEGRNPALLRIMQNKNKFTYNLFKIINTACYIIGKELIQNDYQAISSQKWMRKYTQKKFRRYDLLLRDQQRCLIIDWKFTYCDAQQKIRGERIKRKSQIYCQLARKDFKNQIKLKLYCFHTDSFNQNYHSFSAATFQERVSIITIDQQDKKKDYKAKIEVDYSQISISDSEEDIGNSDQAKLGSLQKDQSVIEIISSSEQQNQLGRQAKNARQEYSVKSHSNRSQNQTVRQNKHKFSISQLRKDTPKSQAIITNKYKIKTGKQSVKQNGSFFKCPIQVYEIQSD